MWCTTIGAYLNAVSNALTWDMGEHPVYLWTLPMFHCNGWCFPWTLAVNAGTSICLRQVREEAVYQAIGQFGVTHFCGAPVVLNTLLNAPDELKRLVKQPVKTMTGVPRPRPRLFRVCKSRVSRSHTCTA